jgi:uncharacterized delta-60 repeat protein
MFAGVGCNVFHTFEAPDATDQPDVRSDAQLDVRSDVSDVADVTDVSDVSDISDVSDAQPDTKLDTQTCTDGVLPGCDSLTLVETESFEIDISAHQTGFSSQGIVVDDQGRLVLAAQTGPSDDQDIIVLRYTPDGNPDPGFGDDGQVRLSLGSVGEGAKSVSVQSDTGTITVVGGSGDEGVIVRLEASGERDVDFGTNGVRRILPAGYDTAVFNGHDFYSNASNAPNKPALLVGGQTRSNAVGLSDRGWDFLISSLLPNGQPYLGFGQSGHVMIDFNQADEFGNSPKILPNDDFLFSGSSYSGGQTGHDCAVVRYDNKGEPVDQFGGDLSETPGGIAIDVDGQTDRCSALFVFPNSDFIAAGYATSAASGEDFLLVRRTSAGAPAAGFGNPETGITLVDMGADEQVRSVTYVTEPAPRVVAAGFRTDGSGSDDFAVAVLREDGSLDASEQSDGTYVYDVSQGSEDRLHFVTESNGELLFLGSTFDGISEKLVIRRMKLVPADECQCE